ncbi:VanZ family protein [Psychrobacillus sp. FSL H8-0484]|uniref:VanZ family protein n=1 Tax=Psychrobacillus sp. FSL H8-0484 TaxID=2921390 RepID=UPI0030F9C9C7
MFIYPFLTFLWSSFILVAICTFDAYAFLYNQVVGFTFQTNPNFSELFIINDMKLTEKFYVIQKTGHMICFAILYVLHLLWVRKYGIAFVLTVIFAAFTEILQLYFYRNGRLVDVAIDLVGISFAYLICKYVLNKWLIKMR